MARNTIRFKPDLHVHEKVKAVYRILKLTLNEFWEDNCPRLAAAISYYTVFSLPPLLVLVITVASLFIDPETVRGTLNQQVVELVGEDAARQIETMIELAERPGAEGPVATVIGIVTFLFGATVAFAQLQAALNEVWEVKPDPGQGAIKNFAIKRVLSFAMILGIALLLLVSLLISAALSIVVNKLEVLIPEGVSGPLLIAVNTGVSFIVVTLLFAAIFRVLPDAVIAWRDVWVGAAVTGLLFVIGKHFVSLYIGNSNPGSPYGAAESLAIVLVWIYLSAMILLLGAEFTQVWAQHYGKRIVPAKGATHVIEKREQVEDEAAEGT